MFGHRHWPRCVLQVNGELGGGAGDGSSLRGECGRPFPSKLSSKTRHRFLCPDGWSCWEELNSAGTTQVCDAANFVTRRRAVRAAQRLYSHLTIQKELFRVFKGPFVPADSERSQNFDLGRCRFQGPIRSPSLEGKGLSHAKIGVKTGVKLFHQL